MWNMYAYICTMEYVSEIKFLGTKEFRHQYTLMRHLPTHTDERNFKCEMCGKAFRQVIKKMSCKSF
jgi:hypothetical protein